MYFGYFRYVFIYLDTGSHWVVQVRLRLMRSSSLGLLNCRLQVCTPVRLLTLYYGGERKPAGPRDLVFEAQQEASVQSHHWMHPERGSRFMSGALFISQIQLVQWGQQIPKYILNCTSVPPEMFKSKACRSDCLEFGNDQYPHHLVKRSADAKAPFVRAPV